MPSSFALFWILAIIKAKSLSYCASMPRAAKSSSKKFIFFISAGAWLRNTPLLIIFAAALFARSIQSSIKAWLGVSLSKCVLAMSPSSLRLIFSSFERKSKPFFNLICFSLCVILCSGKSQSRIPCSQPLLFSKILSTSL